MDRLFQRVLKARPGQVERELRRAARAWKGRRFRNDPRRPFQTTYSTLRRLFYAWKRDGKSALWLDYKAGGKSEAIPGLLTAALETEVYTLSQVARLASGRERLTVHALRCSLPGEVLRCIKSVLKHRRLAAAGEQRLRAELAKHCSNAGGAR